MIGSTATLASTYTAAARISRPPTTMTTVVVRRPREVVAGERDPDQQGRDAGDDQRGAEVVDVHRALDDRQVQRLLQQEERDHGERQADEEAAAPAEGGVDDHATDERATDGGEGERRTEVAGVAAALTRRDHRRDDDLHQRGQATDAETLDDPGADQHLHAGRERRHQGPERVDDQRRLDQQLLAEQVGELAPDRGAHGHREHRRDDDPGVAGLAAVQVADDAGQRVGDDGAREHRDEHGEQQAAEGLQDLAVGHLAGPSAAERGYDGGG